MAWLPGHRIRVLLSDGDTAIPTVAHSVKGVSIDRMTPDLDVSNSEGEPGNTEADAAESIADSPEQGSFSTTIPGLKKCNVTIRGATYDDEGWPFNSVDPVPFSEGDYISCIVFPDKNDLTKGHHFPSLLVKNVKHEMEVDGLQPVTLECVTDGFYSFRSDL